MSKMISVSYVSESSGERALSIQKLIDLHIQPARIYTINVVLDARCALNRRLGQELRDVANVSRLIDTVGRPTF